MEIKEKETDIITYEPANKKEQEDRKGDTIIKSASIKRNFAELMEENNISPTEAMRVGIAVCLAEVGIRPYDNKLNRERLDEIRNFLEQEKLTDFYEAMKILIEKVETINKIERGNKNK